MKKICVVGSLNMDLVVTVDRFPEPGETITGREFATYPGGKGGNQAVALGRLGADVLMIGKLGNDLFGEQYLNNLKENGVILDGVKVEEGVSSGIAVIEVDSTGENHIVIVPGANGKVDRAFIEENWHLMEERDIFLFQLEIPIDTVLYAVKKLKKAGKIIILDPAPARILPDDIFLNIDYITPNETEIETLTGIRIKDVDDLKEAGHWLVKKGVKNVIAKAGKKGAYLATSDDFVHVPGFTVEAVDTTAAGDSFNAGFAFALAQGKGIIESIQFANAVGAISTTAKGAQSAMPFLRQVETFIGQRMR
ncbi:ribokinase [Caldicoprobacter faecalis]|uniref:Ribokinase n=1 Tax=Caldicoprobacter faecalis TaxID=937334 RepID=A0A1I5VFK0_9FIRM|nr:ribokinase [Caldicoprobacter faecalis]PZN07506.1 MAG: ribokinase [Caldicoprobacter oshimai]SFQ06334.1 ribokinase [Caldicoprobacter faecalis]